MTAFATVAFRATGFFLATTVFLATTFFLATAFFRATTLFRPDLVALPLGFTRGGRAVFLTGFRAFLAATGRRRAAGFFAVFFAAFFRPVARDAFRLAIAISCFPQVLVTLTVTDK